ncbi:MAG: ABC transporter ATP-binding protein [Lachnospiraceae bacterium]|nr:ABC transporter ATP-binding protein [Candidatus Colinaster scatohippi]
MSTMKKVFIYLKRHMFFVVLSIAMALLSSLTALYVPVLLGDAIDCCKDLASGTQNSADSLGKLAAFIYKGMGTENYNPMSALVACLIGACLVVAITALLQWLMSLINNRITYEVTRDIRRDAFGKIQRLPLSYLDMHPTGEVVSRMISDVDTFADGLLLGFTQAFTGIVTIFGTIYYMWTLSHTTTIVVVCVTPLSLFVANFIAKKTHNLFILQSETRGEQTALIDEILGNEKIVKSFGYEDEALERFDEINGRLEKCSLNALFYSSLVNPSTRFVNATVYAIVALVGAFRVLGGHISVGSLSALLAYATQYTKPFNEISAVVTELQNAFACASRVFELMEEPDEQGVMVGQDESGQDAEKGEVMDTAMAGQSTVTGNVQVDKVDFSYVPDKPLIEDFSIDVKAGQMVAIVGPTGCGKTTLINLLMRFYDVLDGSIRIDGRDITELNRQAHRERFGMVLQETWIKNASVLDNIKIGRPNATREECVEAAKAAHAHSFIKRLPEGYDTILSEDGGELSAGQKQLLCISRVMLALPPILILDEATSSIDTRTELKIQAAFHTLMEGRTSFIVAHRLSTIMDADIIVVMKDGHIIEQGAHEELLAKKGFYFELFNAQFSH